MPAKLPTQSKPVAVKPIPNRKKSPQNDGLAKRAKDEGWGKGML